MTIESYDYIVIIRIEMEGREMPSDTFYNLPEEKRKRILDAAAREFADKGYAEGSIQSISSVAEVAKGSIYQYFEDKKELFLYIFGEAIKSRVNLLSEVIRDNAHKSFFEIIEQLILCEFNYARENPELYKICRTTSSKPVKEISDEVDKRINLMGYEQKYNLVKDAVEKGEIRGDISIEFASYMVSVMLGGFGDYLLYREDCNYKDYIGQFIDVLKRGIKEQPYNSIVEGFE
jgi:AcrR family transcriptional regulator